MAHETIERVHPDKEQPFISYGLPYTEACVRHLTETLKCSRPFLVFSRSLSKNTDAVEQLKKALNNDTQHIAGIRIGMQPHTLYSEVLQIAEEVKKSGADSIITVGGGSIVDGAKCIVLALANDALTHEKLDLLLKTSSAARNNKPPPPNAPAVVHPSAIPFMVVSTTLSAGEFNGAHGSATDDTSRHKQSFTNPGGIGPRVIVIDPNLTLTTPERVWLSTGLRAVDHCVETICSSNPDPRGTERSLKGLGLLVPGLLRSKQDAGDLEARLRCQLGAAESMKAFLVYGVRIGGSHGIGHQLGPIGVPHAETTCVCLPAVQKYNSKANAHQQGIVLDAFWADPAIAGVLAKHSLVEGEADLGDALDAIIRELGLPRTLKDYGIGRDKLEGVAENSLKDPCCQWNAIPLEKKEQVLEILENCLGEE